MPDESHDLYGAAPSSAAAPAQREPGWYWVRDSAGETPCRFDPDEGRNRWSYRGQVYYGDNELTLRKATIGPQALPPGGPDEAAVPYRYSYSQSRMEPPFWIVKDGRRHLAEVWKEDDAQRLVAALAAIPAPSRDAEIEECKRAVADYFVSLGWEKTVGQRDTLAALNFIDAALKSSPAHAAPIDMVLFCPACGVQHIDAPEPLNGWTNPPHKTHSCHGCAHLWRPASVATNGVDEVPLGSTDTRPEIRIRAQAAPKAEASDLERAQKITSDWYDLAENAASREPRQKHSALGGGVEEDDAFATLDQAIAEALAAVRREAESAGWDAAVQSVAEPNANAIESIVRADFLRDGVYSGYNDEAKHNEWIRCRNLELGPFRRRLLEFAGTLAANKPKQP